MAKPIAPAKDIAFAAPNVCQTNTPSGPVPIPYVSVAQLADATNVSNSNGDLLVKGTPVLLENSEVASSSGDEPGTTGLTSGQPVGGSCRITQSSQSVLYNGRGLVRFGDTTLQNNDNASGMVLSAEPSVMVGD